MKSKNYTLSIGVISCLAALIMVSTPSAQACGPFFPCIPTPKFFSSADGGRSSREFEKMENLRLWQELTSPEIPLEDIDEVVYGDGEIDHESAPDNLFYAYITKTNDFEIETFLSVAKDLEIKRKEITSPWYYPDTRDKSTGDFSEIIDLCRAYRGTRLKDRYALQLVRALFAARDYAGCVESYDEYFGEFPESNLLKRMAKKYVAGCWSRLGDVDRANEYFAQAGDFNSIVHDNAVAYMAQRNADCPELMAYIESCSTDSAYFCAIKPAALQVISDKKTRYPGDWEFYLAYEAGEFHEDYAAASRHIALALQSQFSSEDFHDHARAYRMKIDALLGRRATLLADLQWIEKKINALSADATDWSRMLRNIIYANWIPNLWKHQDYATAILLCSYGDNLDAKNKHHLLWPTDNRRFCYLTSSFISLSLEEMRNSTIFDNSFDYSNPSFRLMNSLTSAQLISVKHAIAANTPLYRHLKRYARHDSPYYDELIGTLALREERYSLAADYLARVPEKYLATLNIYKQGYLNKNPFSYSPGHWQDFDSIASPIKAKYHFACRMLHYQKQMRHGKSADERGMARLKYAIGRRNSLEVCWALTQYWRGTVSSLFMPSYSDWGDDFLEGFPELHDFGSEEDWEAVDSIFDRESKAAIAMIKSEAVRAEAEYLLFNLATIAVHYPDTPTGKKVKTSCDQLRNWF